MIKPKKRAYILKQCYFTVWWTPTTMISQTGGRLRAFKFYSYLSPVLRIRKQFYFQVFFFDVSNLYNCFNCRSHHIHFISFLILVHFLTWKLEQIRSLSNIYLFLPLWNVTLQKIFSMVWNENKKTKKNEDVLCPFVSFREFPQLWSEAYHFLLSFIYLAISSVPCPWKRRRKIHLYWTTRSIFTSRFQYALRNFFKPYWNAYVYWWGQRIFIKRMASIFCWENISNFMREIWWEDAFLPFKPVLAYLLN